MSGRPMPRINSRVGPPPSGSLGMSPTDCTISSSSGTVIAKMSTSGEPLGRSGRASGASAGGGGNDRSATPIIDCRRAKTAPKPTSRAASGRPNRATRCHSAPRMAAAAIGTGVSQTRPWLAEIASASEIVPLSCFCAEPPAMGRNSGVRSANADAGTAPMPATRPRQAAILSDESHGQRFCQSRSFAASRSDALVVSARPEMNPAATMTRPGEYIIAAKPLPKFCVRTEVVNPAT